MSVLPTITTTSTDEISFNVNPSFMETLLMAPKRGRGESLLSSEGNLSKTPRLSHYDSPHRIVTLIDKRFEKQSDFISALINKSESRLLTVIDKSMSDFRRELSKVNDRVKSLSDRVENIETVTGKIESMKSEIDSMKTEIESIKINNNIEVIESLKIEIETLKANNNLKYNDSMKVEIESLKSKQLKYDNLQVACDLRINGVPYEDGENLYQLFDHLCDTLNIKTPTVKSMYRINNIRNDRYSPDAVILVNLISPFDKNYVLKNISMFRKSNKSNLLLKHIGYDSDNPFYVNENLTTYNYKIFLNALKLRKQKHLESVFTLRGLVYVKRAITDPPILIDCIDQLTQLFRENSEQTLCTNNIVS